MTDAPIARVVFREEGDYFNAYIMAPDTDVGMLLLGSIRKSAADDIFFGWRTVMVALGARYAKDVFGAPVEVMKRRVVTTPAGGHA